MELIQTSIDALLKKEGLNRDTSLEVQGLYVLAGKSGPLSKVEIVEDFDEATFTAKHTPIKQRGICAFELVYEGRVLGEVKYIISPEQKVVSEYETAKIMLEQAVGELNRQGYHLSYDSSQKGYRQQLMENIESHPVGHLTLGPKGLDEATAKAIFDAIRRPPPSREEFLAWVKRK